MYSAFETFVKTINIGEKIFDLSYSDYQDAYDFSNNYFSNISEHMIDFFENHSPANPGEYEYDLIRYIFIKAIEHRISSDLYSQTPRGNICDIFHSPFDIILSSYPTNLPKHLEDIVNDYQKEGHAIAQSIIETIHLNKEYAFRPEILNAIQFVGQTIGYHVGQDNIMYQDYFCSNMLTRNEINELAGHNLCNWLENNGYKIVEANFTRDTNYNVIAKKHLKKYFILMSAEIAPDEPSFIPQDCNTLYEDATQKNAIPFYASVSLGSKNKKHFSDGVILYGDEAIFKINTFNKLEIE